MMRIKAVTRSLNSKKLDVLMPSKQQDKHKIALEISQILYRIRYRTVTVFALEKGYATTLVISP